MAHHNRFVIRNDLPNALTLNVEPEGAFFPLSRGEEVSVQDAFSTAPVTLKLSSSADGDTILSIWPGDGEVRVEKDGVDVFDLVQRASAPDPASPHNGAAGCAEPFAAVDRPRE